MQVQQPCKPSWPSVPLIEPQRRGSETRPAPSPLTRPMAAWTRLAADPARPACGIALHPGRCPRWHKAPLAHRPIFCKGSASGPWPASRAASADAEEAAVPMVSWTTQRHGSCGALGRPCPCMQLLSQTSNYPQTCTGSM